MNIAKISDAVNNHALEAQALEARQWAIITNAVRELTYAVGYNGPFRDNDMRIALAFKAAAARLHGADINHEEHLPLAIAGEPTAPEISRVVDILEKGLEEVVKSTPTKPVAATGNAKKS